MGHTGGDTGLSAFMFFDPQTGVGKVFVTNTEINERNAAQFRAIWQRLDGRQ